MSLTVSATVYINNGVSEPVGFGHAVDVVSSIQRGEIRRGGLPGTEHATAEMSTISKPLEEGK